MNKDFNRIQKNVQLFTEILRAEHGEEVFNARIQEYKTELQRHFDNLQTVVPNLSYMDLTKVMFALIELEDGPEDEMELAKAQVFIAAFEMQDWSADAEKVTVELSFKPA